MALNKFIFMIALHYQRRLRTVNMRITSLINVLTIIIIIGIIIAIKVAL